jgi:hypothetical protein
MTDPQNEPGNARTCLVVASLLLTAMMLVLLLILV